MAICCGGKKQKVSHLITSSINSRRSSEKHNGHIDRQLNSSSTIRHRSHSHFNHRLTNQNHLLMPHDVSCPSANSSSSSSALHCTPQRTSSTNNTINNNHYHHKNKNKIDIMDISDNDDDDELTLEDDNKQPKKLKQNFDRSFQSQYSNRIVHADMIFYCFEILGHYLFNGKHHLLSSSTNGQLVPSSVVPPTLPSEPHPLFVTWLIGSEQKLRGCIGTFTPMNLAQGTTIISKDYEVAQNMTN